MTALTAAADHEIGRLLEENRHLAQDLKQCQADKDFVWSLWKKLQVTNPDVTEAVGLVVQREREKAEQRDRKVLEILQRKDDRIDELQANLAYKTRELGQSTVKQGDVSDEVYQLQRQVDMLQDRNSTLELQLKKVKRSKCVSESPRRDQTNQRLSNMSPKRSKSVKEVETPDIRTRQTKHARSSQVRNIEGRERNLEGAHSETIQALEREKRELSQRVQSMGHDLDKARSDKADEMALRVQLESKVTALDRDVQQKLGKFEQLVTELEEARSVLRKFESQVRQMQQDLDYKNTELETVRRELAELWTTHNQLTEHSSQQADLIRQIQSLQTDTQKMMKNQEEAYCMESSSIQQMYTDLTARYDQAKKAESELRSQVLTLKKEIMDREDIISDLKRQLDKRHTRDLSGSYLDQDEKVEPVLDLEFKCRGMQKEIDNLRRQLLEREGQIEALEEDAINQTIEFDVARLNRHERTHSTPSKQVKSVALSPMRGPTEWPGKSQRSRSMSPRREVLTSKPRLHIQKDLDDCRMILKLKN
ncbi:CNTLN-like protein [Mya arenaria]|uniref:CNTLN-like protein n=1 Tax=Mya arenaria TaxID=6604 RepID=A0ABY7DVT2_MYAAR|nr:CNTLN-like protein [Mya arenaria]